MNADERQIRELVQTWMTASKAGDFAAVLDLMTEDVIFMTPGRPPQPKIATFISGGLRIETEALQTLYPSGYRSFSLPAIAPRPVI